MTFDEYNTIHPLDVEQRYYDYIRNYNNHRTYISSYYNKNNNPYNNDGIKEHVHQDSGNYTNNNVPSNTSPNATNID